MILKIIMKELNPHKYHIMNILKKGKTLIKKKKKIK